MHWSIKMGMVNVGILFLLPAMVFSIAPSPNFQQLSIEFQPIDELGNFEIQYHVVGVLPANSPHAFEISSASYEQISNIEIAYKNGKAWKKLSDKKVFHRIQKGKELHDWNIKEFKLPLANEASSFVYSYQIKSEFPYPKSYLYLFPEMHFDQTALRFIKKKNINYSFPNAVKKFIQKSIDPVSKDSVFTFIFSSKEIKPLEGFHFLAYPKSQNPWKYINDFLNVDYKEDLEDIKQFALLHTRSQRDSLEKIWALFENVRSDFFYFQDYQQSNLFRPHPTHEILKNKRGDCKDLSYLLMTALTSIGFDAALGYTQMSSDPFQIKHPNLHVFNHVVCMVKYQGQYLILDPTQKNYSINYPPMHLQGQDIFVVGAAKGFTYRCPQTSAKQNHSKIKIDLYQTGHTFKGTIQESTRGYLSFDKPTHAFFNQEAQWILEKEDQIQFKPVLNTVEGKTFISLQNFPTLGFNWKNPMDHSKGLNYPSQQEITINLYGKDIEWTSFPSDKIYIKNELGTLYFEIKKIDQQLTIHLLLLQNEYKAADSFYLTVDQMIKQLYHAHLVYQ